MKNSQISNAQIKGTKINDAQTNDSQINDIQTNDSQINDTQINTAQDQSQSKSDKRDKQIYKFPAQGGASMKNSQIKDAQISDTEINDSQINDIQTNDTQTGDSQISSTQINDTQTNDSQINDTQINTAQDQSQSYKPNRPVAPIALINKGGVSMKNAQANDTPINNSEINDAKINDAQTSNSRINDAQMNDSQTSSTQMDDSQTSNIQIHKFLAQRNIAFTGFFAALLALGAVLVLAAPSLLNGNSDNPAEYYDTLNVRWIDYGVLPALEHSELDNLVSYNQLADVLYKLLGYTLDEKYTYLSGHMLVREDQALYLLSQAMGRTSDFGLYSRTPVSGLHNPSDSNIYTPDTTIQARRHLSFAALADMLDRHIQIFVSNETVINLEGVRLDGALVINNPGLAPFIMLNDAQGAGDIFIVPSHNGILRINNLNTTGKIHIMYSPNSMIIDISDSAAYSLHFYGVANVTLAGNTEIEKIYFNNAGSVNSRLLSQEVQAPGIFINSPHVRLDGNFPYVENNLNNHIIFADGTITNFYAHGNVLVIGEARIEYSSSNNGFLQIISPHHLELGLSNLSLNYLELLSVWNDMLNTYFDALLYFFRAAFNIDFQFDFRSPFLYLPGGTLHEGALFGSGAGLGTGGTGGGGFGGGAGSGSNPGTGSGGPPINATPITNIDFDIVMPHIEPIAGVPYGLLMPGHFAQRHMIPSRQFTGIISWHNEDGTPLISNYFNPYEAYTAHVVLTARSGYFFASDAEVTITTFGSGRYQKTSNLTAGARPANSVVFVFDFSPILLRQASAFEIAYFQGPAQQLHINTENLEDLAPPNFRILFGNDLNSAIEQTIDAVSGYQAGGYYIITLANDIIPDGHKQLFVRMQYLPHHQPHPGYVMFRPQMFHVPQPELMLSSNTASIGDSIRVYNLTDMLEDMPEPNNFAVIALSIMPAPTGVDAGDFLWQTADVFPIWLQGETFVVDDGIVPHTPYTYRVYVVIEGSDLIVFVGLLEVLG